MKNKSRLNLLAFFLSSLLSCQHKPVFMEVSQSGLTVQLMKLQAAPGEVQSNDYVARLIPSETILRDKGPAINNKLWYTMDSCFYLQSGKNKVFAELVQPIANGLPGRPEYRIIFKDIDIRDTSWNLVYEDRYLNRKKYTVKLNKIE